MAQSTPPSLTIDQGSQTCTGAGASPTDVQCYVNNPSLAVSWNFTPDSACRKEDGCHIEYCITATSQPNGNNYLPCLHQWQHYGAAQSLTLPSTPQTYTVYGECRVHRTGTDGTDTITLSHASAPWYVALNPFPPVVVINVPAGLQQDDNMTSQTQYINGTEAQWVSFFDMAPTASR